MKVCIFLIALSFFAVAHGNAQFDCRSLGQKLDFLAKETYEVGENGEIDAEDIGLLATSVSVGGQSVAFDFHHEIRHDGLGFPYSHMEFRKIAEIGKTLTVYIDIDEMENLSAELVQLGESLTSEFSDGEYDILPYRALEPDGKTYTKGLCYGR